MLESFKFRLKIIDFVELVYFGLLHDLVQNQHVAIQWFNFFIHLGHFFLGIFIFLSQMFHYYSFLSLLPVVLVVKNDLNHILVDLNVLQRLQQLHAQPLIFRLQIFNFVNILPFQDFVVLVHDVVVVEIEIVLAGFLWVVACRSLIIPVWLHLAIPGKPYLLLIIQILQLVVVLFLGVQLELVALGCFLFSV